MAITDFEKRIFGILGLTPDLTGEAGHSIKKGPQIRLTKNDQRATPN